MEYLWPRYSVRIAIERACGADLQHEGPYVARQLLVRKVVPTLTSKSAEIYPSMAGAKQLGDTSFILVPAGAIRSAVVCSGTILRCTMVLAEGRYKRGGRGGWSSRSRRY
jgi:hypothetical protein